MYHKPSRHSRRGLHNPHDRNAQPGDVTMVTDDVAIDIFRRTGVVKMSNGVSTSTPLVPITRRSMVLDDCKVLRRHGAAFKRSRNNTITLPIYGVFVTRTVVCPVSIAHRDGVMNVEILMMFTLTRVTRDQYVIVAPVKWIQYVLDQLSTLIVYNKG